LATPFAIVLDLDNTLYSYDECEKPARDLLLSDIGKLLSISITEASSLLKLARQNVKDRLGETASSHSRLLYISEMWRLYGAQPRPDHFIELENNFWQQYLRRISPYMNSKNFLKRCRELNVLLVLVTDLTSAIQYQKLVSMGLESYFDCIVTSEELGADKISGKPFELVHSSIPKLATNSTWYIGDGAHDYDQTNVNVENRYFRVLNGEIVLEGERKIEGFTGLLGLLNSECQ
jgi:putative hydrolase of the HAD superfamily